MNSHTFENIPIGYIGLNDKLCTVFNDPENGQVDLTIMGRKKLFKI